MNKKRTLMIVTGGTIGCVEESGVTVLNNDRFGLLAAYKEAHDTSDITFETMSPFYELSENMGMGHIKKLVQIVKSAYAYDAIFITHGTDTIEYTACMLEWTCKNINTPVFLISSNKPVTCMDSNGLVNFHGAVIAARHGADPGIYISYKNKTGKDAHLNEPLFIHRGIAVLPREMYGDEIKSVCHKEYAYVARERMYPRHFDYTDQECREISPLPVDKENVLMLSAYPSMGDQFLGSLLWDTDAVVINTYHSGTLPVTDKGFFRFCEIAKDKQIPVYACGIGEYNYDGMEKYKDMGITAVRYATPAAVYTKLLSRAILSP